MNESISPLLDTTVQPDRDTSKLHRQAATEASTVSAAHSHQVMPKNTTHDQVSQLFLHTGNDNQTDIVAQNVALGLSIAQNVALGLSIGQSSNMII